ncbi:hypothetical protein ES705_32613 [subsurface metagenome]
MQTGYSKGILYILTIPENFSDLYNLPEGVLTLIKEKLMQDLYVKVESRSKIGLFAYSNKTFIVHSFLSEREVARIVAEGQFEKITEINTKEITKGLYNGKTTEFTIRLNPHSYKVFRLE